MEAHELKKIREEKQTVIFEKYNVFFAFSNEQLRKGVEKCNLQEGEKIISMGLGGYLPKKHLDDFLNEMEALNKWFKEQGKNKAMRRKLIAYELSNHEAFYTRDIDDTLNALGDGYTYDEVYQVYLKEQKKHSAYMRAQGERY